jgi:hypothetical protein
MADVQGGMPLKRALARTMASAFWWWIMAGQRLLESTFCVPYSVSLRCRTGQALFFVNWRDVTYLFSSQKQHHSQHLTIISQQLFTFAYIWRFRNRKFFSTDSLLASFIKPIKLLQKFIIKHVWASNGYNAAESAQHTEHSGFGILKQADARLELIIK